jgi:hypothetical protein
MFTNLYISSLLETLDEIKLKDLPYNEIISIRYSTIFNSLYLLFCYIVLLLYCLLYCYFVILLYLLYSLQKTNTSF